MRKKPPPPFSQYLSSCFCTYKPPHTLRSSHENLLKISIYKLKTFRQRSFSFLTPTVWNSLPSHPRNTPSLPSFKKHTKMYLFPLAFSDHFCFLSYLASLCFQNFFPPVWQFRNVHMHYYERACVFTY